MGRPKIKPIQHPKIKNPIDLGGLVRLAAGFILSALLLTFCQAPWNLHWLAWFALVPFVFVCRPEAPTKQLIITAYLVSFLYWLGNLYWIIPITGPGYIAFAAWQAVYWPLLALGMCYLRKRNRPLAVFIPILFVGAESFQSFVFTGFSWYFLSHSQYANTTLIQLADLFGSFGVSILITAVNGAIATGLISIQRQKRLTPQFWNQAICAMLLAGGALVYGHLRLKELDSAMKTESGLVGVVQTNVPSAVKEEIENAQAILDDLFKQSDQCIAAGATLIVWPETMVLTVLNAGYRDYCDPNSESVRFNQQIENYAQNNKCHLLVGAPGGDVGIVGGKLDVTNRYNSAYLYTPNGRQSDLRYDKIHLVPFGEYIPFKKSCPPLYKIFMIFNPYDYDYNLTPGTEFTLFPVQLADKEYHFGILICYEDTDPAISRRMVFQNGTKDADWLVNMSNDGWYVHFKDKKVIPSVELSQRTAITVFRCIENRISIIRSVNTGISCLVTPEGRIQNRFANGDLPVHAMERQGVEGWFIDNIPINNIVTFYSRHGTIIDKIPAIVVSLIPVSILLGKLFRRKIR